MLQEANLKEKKAVFPTTAEAATFALFTRYPDVLHLCHPYATLAHEISAEESASLLHAANHVLQKMDRVKRNNQKLESNSVTTGFTCDQGFVRPSVLLLAPMRCIALTLALRFAMLAQRESRYVAFFILIISLCWGSDDYADRDWCHK